MAVQLHKALLEHIMVSVSHWRVRLVTTDANMCTAHTAHLTTSFSHQKQLLMSGLVCNEECMPHYTYKGLSCYSNTKQKEDV